ncbi:hypothetical protein PIB30_042729 [Stylosanthes scabra]|uniref:Uncharacterized protein n=1 Tax=Stylosanthes scabra TaxID=79078 RepID=A0ABU6QEU8_9FABA|nr:hypothetical protein [Stylosanthes scabra]
MGKENVLVHGCRDPSSFFVVEFDCVCSVFYVGIKVFTLLTFISGGLRGKEKETRGRARPEPTPIDEEEIWTWIAGGRKKGRMYGKSVVPVYSIPLLIGDFDDDDTATGFLDLREQVTPLNKEISQQAEVHRQRVAEVEAVCDEKMRTLETALEYQS